MPTYVVATDLSPASRKAAATTAKLAERTGAGLDFYCAVPKDLIEDLGQEDLLPRVREEVSRLARTYADRGLAASAHVAVVKNVADGIVRHAERVGAALVAVAPQGATGWKRLVLGSVTEQVLRRAPPLLLVARPARPMPPKNILIAVDRSPGASRALRGGLELAARLGSTATVLWAPRPVGALLHFKEALDSTVDYRRKRGREKKLGREFDEWVREFDAHGVEVTTRVEEGDAPRTILTQARLTKSSLIVMGAHSRNRAQEVLVGSVARAVATAAPQSVLLIRARPPARRR